MVASAAEQHLAVAGDHQDAALRLREGETEPDHRRLPHRAPQGEAQIRVPGGRDVPRGGAQAGDDQQPAAFLEELLHHVAPMQFRGHWFLCSWKLLMPTTR